MPAPGFPSLLLRAGMRHLWRHHWQGFLALTGIALGVAVVLAVDMATQAARASFRLSAAELQGAATHRLLGHGGKLPESLYVQLRRQPGCPPMAPVVTGRVQVADQPGRYRLLGVDLMAEAPFRRGLAVLAGEPAALRAFLVHPGAVVLSGAAAQTLAVRSGDRLQIEHQGRRSTLELLRIGPAGHAASRDLLLVDVATAQALLGMHGFLSYIDLILDAGTEAWLRQRLPAGLELVAIAEQAEGMTRMSAAFELNLTAMSLLALLVGMFLVFNAMTFSVVQRRPLLGRLRAVGVTPRELFRLLLAEALIIGIAGTLVGLLLGIWLSQGLIHLVAATISELYYQTSVQALFIAPLALLKAGG
ncbi:MAG: ABC transporter permease, partial [Gammaproteobacteria bacterium]